jgi:hypothetical protein
MVLTAALPASHVIGRAQLVRHTGDRADAATGRERGANGGEARRLAQKVANVERHALAAIGYTPCQSKDSEKTTRERRIRYIIKWECQYHILLLNCFKERAAWTKRKAIKQIVSTNTRSHAHRSNASATTNASSCERAHGTSSKQGRPAMHTRMAKSTSDDDEDEEDE